MCAGSDSLLCFALASRSLACEYSIQAVQSCDVGLQSKPQSEELFVWEHVQTTFIIIVQGIHDFGMTCGITSILWDSLQDKYDDILYLFLDQRLSQCSQILDYLYRVHDLW